jgi:hypothetical protein
MFCKRAWWFQQRGVKSNNQLLMDDGREIHHRHSLRLILVGVIRFTAAVLFLASMAFLAIYVTRFFL